MAAPPTLGIVATLKDAFRTLSGIVGGAMLAVLLAMVVIVPEWSDIFVPGTLPRTITIQPEDFKKTKVTSETFGITTIILRSSFDYAASYFPGN